MMMRMRRQNPHQTRPMVVRGSGTAVAVFAEGREVMPKTDMEAAVGEPEAAAAHGEVAERQVEAARVHRRHQLQLPLQQPQQQLPRWQQLPLLPLWQQLPLQVTQQPPRRQRLQVTSKRNWRRLQPLVSMSTPYSRRSQR